MRTNTSPRRGAEIAAGISSIFLEPSILSANFGKLADQAKEAETAGADGIQVDVMDGHFVPNITFGPGTVRALRNTVGLFLDAHLMVESPDKFFQEFADAGADRIIVHQEACRNLHRTVQSIKRLKLEAGVAVNPGTPITTIEEVLDLVDCIQVMTVNPGFAGQEFIASQLRKIARLRQILRESGGNVVIAVDGGIDEKTAPLAVSAGAGVLVAGSSVFNSKASVAQNVARLRNSILSVDRT